jgi:hypothetical protein
MRPPAVLLLAQNGFAPFRCRIYHLLEVIL